MCNNPFKHDHNPFCPYTVEGTLFRHGKEICELKKGKQDKLIAGDNITISEDNVISATGGGGGGGSTVLDLRNEIASADNLQPMIDEAESIDTILLPANYDPELSVEVIVLNIPASVKTITAGGTSGLNRPRYHIKGNFDTITLNDGKYSLTNSNTGFYSLYANDADLLNIGSYPQIYLRACTVDNIVPTGGYAVYTTFTGSKGFYSFNPVTLISCYVEKVSAAGAPGIPSCTSKITAINTEFRGDQTIPDVTEFIAEGCRFDNVTLTNSRAVNITASQLGNVSINVSTYAKEYASDRPVYTMNGCTGERITFNNAKYSTDAQPLVIIGSTLSVEPETNAEIRFIGSRVGDEWR